MPDTSHENPVQQWAADKLESGSDLKGWQVYLRSKFPRASYRPIPDYARYMSALWRFATYEHLATDTVVHNGTQMPTLLSMVYQPKIVVEFGVDGGMTTMLLCKLNPDARVYAVDKYSKKRDADVPIGFYALMQGCDNLTVHIQPAQDFVLPNVELCFIDDEHIGDAPYLSSWRAWKNKHPDNWCIAWDDYHPSNPDVVRGVDTFCREVGQQLRHLGSWVYIGSKSHECIEAYR